MTRDEAYLDKAIDRCAPEVADIARAALKTRDIRARGQMVPRRIDHVQPPVAKADEQDGGRHREKRDDSDDEYPAKD